MDYLIEAGLPQLPAGNSENNKLLLPLYLALGALTQKVSDATGQVLRDPAEMAQLSQISQIRSQNMNRMYVKAAVTLAYGKLVHLKSDGAGKIDAELADATNDTKPAIGIVTTTTGITAGAWGEILIFQGYTAGISGTTVGATYYLGTNGDAQIARPSVAGSIIQAVGVGLGSAGFLLNVSSLFIKN